MSPRPIRIAARAVLVHDGRLLLVNAYEGRTDLWCAPGGGTEAHVALTETLRREVREEAGLDIAVGAPCLVNEFHDPDRDFHQIEVFFRATPLGPPPVVWTDPEGVVAHRVWVTPDEAARLQVRPRALLDVAWRPEIAAVYDPLERIIP